MQEAPYIDASFAMNFFEEDYGAYVLSIAYPYLSQL